MDDLPSDEQVHLLESRAKLVCVGLGVFEMLGQMSEYLMYLCLPGGFGMCGA